MEIKDYFILSLFHHGDKVRSSTLYHLLKGKRTTSILIYGYFNQLLPYFSLFPRLEERELTLSIATLLKKGDLHEEEGLVQLSAKGQALLAKKPLAAYPAINGLLYGKSDQAFFELLLFASQVVSESVHEQKNYMPIETNPAKQYRLKLWLRTNTLERQALGAAFYQEWQQLLHLVPAAQRLSVVSLLSGHDQVGRTSGQLAQGQGKEAMTSYLELKQLQHGFLAAIWLQPVDYPVFFSLYQLLDHSPFNESAQKSYQLFQQGLAVTAIATQRQLKESTVVDHLIEYAILDEAFPFEKALKKSDLATLRAYQQEVPSLKAWQFQDVRACDGELSFLTFRCYQISELRRARDVKFSGDATSEV